MQVDDIDLTASIAYGSTGIRTLLVPEFPQASVHPFCMETYHPDAFMHGRHFSSPYSGTVEDPVTGTASVVMEAYYLQNLRTDQDNAEFFIEQV